MCLCSLGHADPLRFANQGLGIQTQLAPFPDKDTEIVTLDVVQDDLVQSPILDILEDSDALAVEGKLQDESVPILVQELVQDADLQMWTMIIQPGFQDWVQRRSEFSEIKMKKKTFIYVTRFRGISETMDIYFEKIIFEGIKRKGEKHDSEKARF